MLSLVNHLEYKNFYSLPQNIPLKKSEDEPEAQFQSQLFSFKATVLLDVICTTALVIGILMLLVGILALISLAHPELLSAFNVLGKTGAILSTGGGAVLTVLGLGATCTLTSLICKRPNDEAIGFNHMRFKTKDLVFPFKSVPMSPTTVNPATKYL